MPDLPGNRNTTSDRFGRTLFKYRELVVGGTDDLAANDRRTYEGSFFALRQQVNELLEITRESPPDLFIYIPLAQSKSADALIELTASATGSLMQPGEPDFNTKLSSIALILPPDLLRQVWSIAPLRSGQRGRFPLLVVELRLLGR